MLNIPKILSKEIKDKYLIKDNTFINRINDEDSERLIVEIGDSKQPIFHPQVKLLKWAEKDGIENETNFSVRLIDDEPTRPRIKTEGNKIKFIKNKREAHFYDIPKSDKHKEGGFEFEVLLKTKPATNKVQMSIETKGLKFYYQPELTQKEKDKGANRPENVVGSYAVYHESKAGDYSKMGKKNYRAGKSFHIYRPRIVDNAGKEVWGRLNIDVKKKLLTVEIPQEFLDNAVYPVIVDPTFGYTTGGASNDGVDNGKIFGTKFSVDSAGTGDSMSVYYKKYTGSGLKIIAAIYDSSDGLISNGTTNESAEVTNTDYAWITMNFGTSPSFSSGVNRLAAQDNGGSFPQGTPLGYMAYDTGDTDQKGTDKDNTYPTFPATFSADSLNDEKNSIYCTYTAGGGGTTQPSMLMMGVGI